MAKAQAVIEERKKAMASLHPPEPKPTTNGAGKVNSLLNGSIHSRFYITLASCFSHQ